MLSVPKNSELPGRIRPTARRGSGTEPATSQPASRSATDAFLRHTFEPIGFNINRNVHPEAYQSVIQNQQQIESDFYRSLTYLYALYKWPLVQASADWVYPYSVYMLYEDAVKRLEKVRPDLELLIVQNDSYQNTALATVQVFQTEANLYYLTLRPYYYLLRHRQQKQVTDLLSCIFLYLIDTVGIPYLTTNDFLMWQYEVITDDYLDEYSEDEEIKAELLKHKKSLRYAITCLRHIRSAKMSSFANLVSAFRPKTDLDQALLDVARKLLVIIDTFPGRSITPSFMVDFDVEEEMQLLRFETYLSFVWCEDEGDLIMGRVNECLDSDFSNGAEFDMPKSIQVFHTAQDSETHCLDFEIQLFQLIIDLSAYLYRLDRAQPEHE